MSTIHPPRSSSAGPIILVTGALGNIGSRVAAKLAAAGSRVRALVRRPADAKLDPAVEVVAGSYDDAGSLDAAMAGVSAALFITAGPALARHDAALAAAARRAGVGRVVKVSVLGARADGSEIPRWHWEGEQAIAASGLPWTFLRPGPFASNALRWLPTLRAKGKAFGAFGAAALPLIHPDDIADVAALALTTSGHEGKIYELTGGEALASDAQLAILREVTGKGFEYVNVDDDAALRGMLDGGVPKVMADATIHLVQALRAGAPAPNGVVKQLLGRPPRTFRAWVQDNAAAFQEPSNLR